MGSRPVGAGSALSTALLALTLGLLALQSAAPVGAHPRAARAALDEAPNIVLITADDMRTADLAWMPKTRALFARYGMEFRNGMAPHPLCCPARAQILTGQYAQNNGVLTNKGAYGGFKALRQPGNHVGAWLKAAGYTTAFLGKYLNNYRWTQHGRQKGWTYWDPTISGEFAYTRFTQARDGTPETIEDGYVTDAVRDTTVDLINDYAGPGGPFFIWASYVAPHSALFHDETGKWTHTPPIPAPRHRGIHAGATPDVWTDPAYDEADMRDKPHTLSRDRVNDVRVQRLFTARIETLAALDDAVAETFASLEEAGELENTIVVFTSDNGFLLGEHRYVGKTLAYEGSLRVPFLAAAPTLPAGTTSARTVTPIDLAATFVEAAGAAPSRVLDGKSFLHASPGDSARRSLLVQAGNAQARKGGRKWDFRGIRAPRYTYVEAGTPERRSSTTAASTPTSW